jgi:hypothetical protein
VIGASSTQPTESKNVNGLYLCCVAEPWVEIIERADMELGIRASYVVHWSHQKDRFVLLTRKDVFLHSMDEAWMGRGFPSKNTEPPLGEPDLRCMAYEELIAIKMMDRMDPLRDGFNFERRQEFFRSLVGSWLRVLDERAIDVVISPSIPHRVFDFALYVAARMRGVRILMFQATVFRGAYFLINDINKMPELSPDPGPNNKLSTVMREKIIMVRRAYENAEPDYMRRQRERDRPSLKRVISRLFVAMARVLVNRSGSVPKTYWVKKGCRPQDSRFTWFEFYMVELRRRSRLAKLKNEYRKCVKSLRSRPYVLLALHYQPEETTCPTGGVFVDQRLIVQHLEAALPSGIDIVIKEHKSQFSPSLEGSSGRDVGWYREVLKISERAYFCGVDINPFGLIDGAEIVVTVSGTIGWESVMRGTPCVIFGRAWYERMPNVFKVKNGEELKAVIKKLSASKGKATAASVESFHRSLQASVVNAKVYWNKGGWPDDGSASNILVALEAALRGPSGISR